MNEPTSLKNLHSSTFIILAVAALLLSGLATPSFAQVLAWTADDGGGVGSGTGDFFDANNWATGTVPIGDNIAPKLKAVARPILLPPARELTLVSMQLLESNVICRVVQKRRSSSRLLKPND